MGLGKEGAEAGTLTLEDSPPCPAPDWGHPGCQGPETSGTLISAFQSYRNVQKWNHVKHCNSINTFNHKNKDFSLDTTTIKSTIIMFILLFPSPGNGQLIKRYRHPKEYLRRKLAHASRLPITDNFRKVFWVSMNTRTSWENKPQRTAW